MKKQDKTLEMFCSALEIKGKMKALYESAIKGCSNPVGVETFKMLLNAETRQMRDIQRVYEELMKGKASAGSCRLNVVENANRNAAIRKIVSERRSMPKACFDDVAAIDCGLQMEHAGIQFYKKELELAVDPLEREFLSRIIEEESEHYKALADLRFLYVAPANWFMEKSRTGLDGAGAFS
jgi:rubrerythrin